MKVYLVYMENILNNRGAIEKAIKNIKYKISFIHRFVRIGSLPQQKKGNIPA